MIQKRGIEEGIFDFRREDIYDQSGFKILVDLYFARNHSNRF
jgi:hypothetical protein